MLFTKVSGVQAELIFWVDHLERSAVSNTGCGIGIQANDLHTTKCIQICSEVDETSLMSQTDDRLKVIAPSDKYSLSIKT